MMKICINPVNFMSENPVKRIELSKKAGFDSIEILGFEKELTQEGLREVKNALKKHEMKATSIAGGPPIALSGGKLLIESDDHVVKERTLNFLKNCVDWANELEANVIYVCPIKKINEINDQKVALDNIHSLFEKIAEYAEGSDIKFAIEHVPGSLIGTSQRLNEVINNFDMPSLGTLLDIGHVNMSKEDPEKSVIQTNKLFHIHLDNNDGKNDIHTPFNVGTLTKEDFINFIRASKNKGYDDYYSIELLNLQEPIKTLKESIEFLRTIYSSL
jgi:sugar phosphate isomerase/epimerase